MPAYVIAVDVFSLILIVAGFNMAFRQPFVRRLIGQPKRPPVRSNRTDDEDPLTYGLRIAGIMIMVFGIALGGMLTLFHLS